MCIRDRKAGISGIIGAFVAGILIGNTLGSRKIENDIKAIGYGFFIPIFFVGVGASIWRNAEFEVSTYTQIAVLAGVLIIVGIIGKIIGCGLGAKLARMSNKQSLQIGIGMIPRMELALIIATAIVTNNILKAEVAHQILVATVLLTIITTILAPFLIKITFKE